MIGQTLISCINFRITKIAVVWFRCLGQDVAPALFYLDSMSFMVESIDVVKKKMLERRPAVNESLTVCRRATTFCSLFLRSIFYGWMINFFMILWFLPHDSPFDHFRQYSYSYIKKFKIVHLHDLIDHHSSSGSCGGSFMCIFVSKYVYFLRKHT